MRCPDCGGRIRIRCGNFSCVSCRLIIDERQPMQTIKIDSETVEVDGEVYRKEKKGSPWPFRPTSGMHPSVMVESEEWQTNAAFTESSRLFPNRSEADKACAHLHRVLKSMRLYENAKAEGRLDELWVVGHFYPETCTTTDRRYVKLCAQAGRLFATPEEAEEYAKTL